LVRNGHKTLNRISLHEITQEKVQQWWCKQCHQSFTFRSNQKRQRFTDLFIKETVKDFIQGRSSYAVIKERKGVSVGTLSKWVRSHGDACMSPVEVAHTLPTLIRSKTTPNHWSGILLLDGKYLNRKQVLLLAIDYLTLDIVAWYVCAAETGKNYLTVIDQVIACGYQIKALVSDGHPALFSLTQLPNHPMNRKGTRTYPRPGITPGRSARFASPSPPPLYGVIHQWCVVHAERELKRMMVKLLIKKEDREQITRLVHQVLFANTLTQAKRYVKQLQVETADKPYDYQRIGIWIIVRWKFLMAHHTTRVGRRKIPRSSNAVENIISYVNTRLKTMRRLRTTTSAKAITNLIVMNYRTKPLINTKNKLKRGKSPLDLVMGKKMKLDWMQFVKKSCS